MKRLALVAAVFALAACAKKDETPADTTAAMAPAPAPTVTTDSTMSMSSSTTAAPGGMASTTMSTSKTEMKKTMKKK